MTIHCCYSNSTLIVQQKFGIKTAGLDEKCTAMQMLVVYAKDLKEGFADYAEPVAKIMVPHLKFFFHELVRAAAAEILPHLLECVKVKGKRDNIPFEHAFTDPPSLPLPPPPNCVKVLRQCKNYGQSWLTSYWKPFALNQMLIL